MAKICGCNFLLGSRFEIWLFYWVLKSKCDMVLQPKLQNLMSKLVLGTRKVYN